jgi:hypothetical protein
MLVVIMPAVNVLNGGGSAAVSALSLMKPVKFLPNPSALPFNEMAQNPPRVRHSPMPAVIRVMH